MFSIFTSHNDVYCDFDSICFFDKKTLARDFGGELLISMKGDEIISNVISDCGYFYLRDFIFNAGCIARNLESEKVFSLAFDEHDLYEVENGIDTLVFSSEENRKKINKHSFVFVLKIILSEINIFLDKASNKKYAKELGSSSLNYIAKY